MVGMRIRAAIFGNSGSGKSTLARWLADKTGAPLLDLDTVAWVPGQIAVPRPSHESKADVVAFCGQESWIIEGCYADLVEHSLAFEPRLLFLNPGVEQCLANCSARPWEPHKYPSEEEQAKYLTFLLDWVRDYYSRSGPMSLLGHRACFDGYAGYKREFTRQVDMEALWGELTAG